MSTNPPVGGERRGSSFTHTRGHKTVTRRDGTQLRSETDRCSFRQDAKIDFVNLLFDLIGAVVKTLIAYFALYHIGKLESNTALATAALLGATDFFAGRGRSKFVQDFRTRVYEHFANGTIIEKETDQHQEGRR